MEEREYSRTRATREEGRLHGHATEVRVGLARDASDAIGMQLRKGGADLTLDDSAPDAKGEIPQPRHGACHAAAPARTKRRENAGKRAESSVLEAMRQGRRHV